MLLHLIRHGDTEGTENKLYYGSTDLPLSKNGALRLREMRKVGEYPDISNLRVYTSGMLRTAETLRELYGEVESEALHDMREMDFGDFEMKSYEQLREMPAFSEWVSGENFKNVCPNGESGERQATRVIAETKRLIDKGEDCLLVAHGGTIVCIMSWLFENESKNYYDWQITPGTGYTIEISDKNARYERIPKLPDWYGKSYAFFQNRDCECFPCHKCEDLDAFNCLFCYCPLYALGEGCGGNFSYNEKGYKVCTDCAIPHRRENFGKIIEKYPQICELAKKK